MHLKDCLYFKRFQVSTQKWWLRGVVLFPYKYSETSQIGTLKIWTSFCGQTWLGAKPKWFEYPNSVQKVLNLPRTVRIPGFGLNDRKSANLSSVTVWFKVIISVRVQFENSRLGLIQSKRKCLHRCRMIGIAIRGIHGLVFPWEENKANIDCDRC